MLARKNEPCLQIPILYGTGPTMGAFEIYLCNVQIPPDHLHGRMSEQLLKCISITAVS